MENVRENKCRYYKPEKQTLINGCTVMKPDIKCDPDTCWRYETEDDYNARTAAAEQRRKEREKAEARSPLEGVGVGLTRAYHA